MADEAMTVHFEPFMQLQIQLVEGLSAPRRIELGAYRDSDRSERQFVIEIDALPLLILFKEAALGARVYELMSISRPGDVFHYVRVLPVDVPPRVSALFPGSQPVGRVENSIDASATFLPFPIFDEALGWNVEDEEPEDSLWRHPRNTLEWREIADDLLASVRNVQELAAGASDALLRNEIDRIRSGKHPRHYDCTVERRCRIEQIFIEATFLPPVLLGAIVELIQRETVQSVSCPFGDYWLWRRLIEEQVKRAERMQLPPQKAFSLSGPDGGLGIPYQDWGGAVHIPYEGACGADLFIKPDWRKLFPENDAEGGRLSSVVFPTGEIPPLGYVCHYLLTAEDLGELRCATRVVLDGGWVLYESKGEYVPNPLFKQSREERMRSLRVLAG